MLFSIRRGRLAALCVSLCVCLAPGAAWAQDTNSLKLPTIVAATAATADWTTTYHALTHYRVHETNPLLKPLDSPGGIVSVGAAIDIGGITAWNLMMGQSHPRLASAGLWAMAAFRGYLAFHNWRNEQRAAPR
jgi:hypothetical protein